MCVHVTDTNHSVGLIITAWTYTSVGWVRVLKSMYRIYHALLHWLGSLKSTLITLIVHMDWVAWKDIERQDKVERSIALAWRVISTVTSRWVSHSLCRWLYECVVPFTTFITDCAFTSSYWVRVFNHAFSHCWSGSFYDPNKMITKEPHIFIFDLWIDSCAVTPK